ncbi:MAG: divalent-cation tolerance protein CutA [Planctomycetes bacterium]|nr:divalent-cation tolerance protein CutA [Planctomycetota bacterium]
MHIVLITAPCDRADDLARSLVAERCCACVNVVPRVTSHYLWEGQQEEDAEALLIAKVAADRLEDFTARVRALHPYAVPEILALAPTGGNPDYIAWVRRGGG